jgi:short-subunit dehydrogenase
LIPQLRGANAILTGGSQGLGALMARELALAGVNLALAARSADKLKAVADEVASLGLAVVAIPADLTREADRQQLVQRAEDALGPVDILINNAGIMDNGAFVRKTPAEIEAMITTNITAPLLLTRAVLPGMLERRRGHIVNISSTAGGGFSSYTGVYAATKAALRSWHTALRVELEGTGVSTSVILPGYVTEVGVFAVLNAHPHWLFGTVKPEAVAQAVMRSLHRDEIEIVVNPLPIRPLFMLYALSPRLAIALGHVLGVVKSWKQLYDRERD